MRECIDTALTVSFFHPGAGPALGQVNSTLLTTSAATGMAGFMLPTVRTIVFRFSTVMVSTRPGGTIGIVLAASACAAAVFLSPSWRQGRNLAIAIGRTWGRA